MTTKAVWVRKDGTIMEPGSEDNDNIPSPPSLSSDDEDDANHIDEDLENDGDAALRRAVHQRSAVMIYADKDVTTYAE